MWESSHEMWQNNYFFEQSWFCFVKAVPAKKQIHIFSGIILYTDNDATLKDLLEVLHLFIFCSFFLNTWFLKRRICAENKSFKADK